MRYRVVVVTPREKVRSLVTHGKTVRLGRSTIIANIYATAPGRLCWLVKNLKSSPEVLQKCDRVIKGKLNSGVVQEVRKDEEGNAKLGELYCNPHR